MYGTIPASDWNLYNMLSLNLGLNQLNGSLPSSLATTAPALQTLRLPYNSFSGTIPSSKLR